MAWKRSSVRSRPGPPDNPIKIKLLDELLPKHQRAIWCQFCFYSHRATLPFLAQFRGDFGRLYHCGAWLPKFVVDGVNHFRDALRHDLLVYIGCCWGARVPQQTLRRLHVALGLTESRDRSTDNLKRQIRQV